MKKSNFLNIGVALLFLIVAIVVLIDLLGLIKQNDILGKYWPVALIFVGLLSFSTDNSRGNGFSFGLAMLGLLLLLNTFGFFATKPGELVLIFLLALSGLMVLLFATSKKPQKDSASKNLDKDLNS